MSIRDIINKLGGTRSIAIVCGVETSTVRYWIHDRRVPLSHHSRIMAYAKVGKIRIRKTDLDPRFYNEQGKQ